jgi:hypothetical protein
MISGKIGTILVSWPSICSFFGTQTVYLPLCQSMSPHVNC